MSNTAIEVSNLGKKYHIAALKENPDTLITALGDIFTAPFRRAGKLLRGQQTGAAELDQEFWALRDINFEVKHGEVMGIIGRNGAGKSTLLKVLSRITEPSEGSARINGRVGSLLEVGTGFHNELTGRENVYLNGSILGMSNAEITNRFDEIVSFSEIGNFLDTPVKHYSSGMKVRLAFAVAAHLDPEILMIDEVLAVGDYAFQKKSLGKMQEVTHSARTVLFVSHQLDMIRAICDRVIWLDGGYVKMIGDATTVVDTYIKSFSDEGNNTSFTCEEEPDRPFQLLSGRILNQDEKASAVFDMFEPITVELDYVIRKSIPQTIIAIQLISNDEHILQLFDTDNAQHLLESRTLGYYRTRVQIPAPLLKQGFYSLSLSIRKPKSDKLYLHELKNALSFEILLSSRAGNHLSYGKGRRIKIVVDRHWENEILRDVNRVQEL
jgi:homopolymeric O-antigen transport system ATP-binding protein